VLRALKTLADAVPLLLVRLQPSSPVMVEIVEPESEATRLSDILIGALGLTGVLALGAVLLAIVMAAVLFAVRARRSRD
jgi:hypothetical protein